MTNYIILLSFLIGGFLLSLLINQLLLSFSKTLGIRNKNDVTVRWSNESKPSLGGVSMFVTFIFSILVYAAIFSSREIFNDYTFLGLLLAASLAFLIGIADDAYNTKPLLKLFGQIMCGLILILSGTSIDLFHNVYLDNVFTILWVIVIMNSLNMLDNMDGITGTVTLFILLTCMTSYFVFNGIDVEFWIIILITQIGTIIAFLRFNINPSKMFMGDTGSQFLGLFVAYFAIEGIWNNAASVQVPAWSSLITVLVAFTPAAVDTLTVFINRIKKGKSPMVGGKDHTTHHLVYKGLTDFKVWIVFLILSVASSVMALALIIAISMKMYLLTLTGLVFFLVAFYYLYRNTVKYRPSK